MNKTYLFLFFLIAFNVSHSQNIKTIQLRPLLNNKQYAAIVPLGTILQLSFDDLDADNKDYQYKIEHMTYDWKTSNLATNQYIEGFEQNEILNFENSFNTLQPYTHYSVNIPNQNTIITKSGNYLISVLNEDDEVIFSRRCVFYEDMTTVGVAVYRSRNTQTFNEQQTVQFSVNYPNFNIVNPAQEIKVTLFQNNDWNTAINNLQPQFFNPNRLIYNYTLKTNFWGGNEFLNFDNKFIRNTSVGVARTERKDIYHNYLYTDTPRADRPYTYNPDINGQFIIRTLEGINANTEADYAMMHFSLDAFEPYEDKNVYIFGAFNNFELNEENLMTYNSKKRMYEASILLKQGFYNYGFVTVDKNNNVNLHEIDGSFFQTENEYTVIVYYKPFGGLYDRVIGVGNGFFNQNR
ncbi:hypothetical protein WH52_03635 [Tenacibaculum holothuriorum]|uniref:Type 9 secretion system plug protein N-terminal domain-containing protein n=1 Tax=Tenacibaculum holothuriorum TaxID=1635173 RepID=A0A1Y2PE74_9FLAO|nr:DUF5103 domain-containing protein [Tenacibaculum holothuriorum]OSY88772.1 hypothetical protein WH52_03635 [Tenacibaculum holothuriorum]